MIDKKTGMKSYSGKEFSLKMMPANLVVAFLAPLLFSACGYFENDGIDYKKRIVGNIGIQRYRDTGHIDLVFDETNDISTIMVSNCHSVYYDSIDKIIYADRPITEWTSGYYRIVLKNPFSRKLREALRKDDIYESTFKKGIKKRNSVEVQIK